MTERRLVHATTVSFNGAGIMITGASGSGKSALALQLMALGCDLVADDQTSLTRHGDTVLASAPTTVQGLIEARGVGILRATSVEAAVVLVVDLDRPETARLPQLYKVDCLGLTIVCLHKVDSVYWPAAILQYLKGGRVEPR